MFLLIAFTGVMLAQSQISGKVVDEGGEPLIGASIIVQNTATGTATDFDGNFELTVPEGSTAIVISYTGFSDKVVNLTAGKSTYDITLAEGQLLDEVVVTALGIQREEKSLGYAVTELGGSELSQSKETNVVNALSGKIAGVQIAGAPSALGGSSRITIRGANSFLGNNQPLFVIDGIPIDNGSATPSSTSSGQARGFGGSVAYDYGNAAQDIDPESIASVTVLKGAAATALYGQRGANGVIQITTKDGGAKKGLGIEVSNQMNFDNVRNLIPHQQQYGGGDIAPTSSGFYEVIQDGVTYLTPAYAKDGAWGPRYDANTQIRHWDSWDENNPATYKETRPWVAPNAGYEEFFDTGISRTTNVALTGATDKGSFRLGYTNLGSTGTMPNSSLDRNSFSLKSAYNLSDRVKATVVGNYIRTEGQGRNVTGYNNGNPMQAFTQWWQTQLDIDRLREGAYRTSGLQQTWNAVGAIVDADNNLIRYEHAPNFFDNPFWVRENYLQRDTRDRLIGGVTLDVDLGKGFSVLGRIGTDFYNTYAVAGIPVESVETSLFQERELTFGETNMEGRLSYRNNLTDKLSLFAFVGGNRMRQRNYDFTAQTAGGLALDGFYNIANSLAAASLNTEESRRGINSVFGGASFGWDNWLYLDVTARNDWSSTLPEGSNSYFYPSVTVSGVLSDLLDFDYSKISFLKVRASYASAGNDAFPYSLVSTFSPQVPNFVGNPRYDVPNEQPNAELRPEFTTEYEFGIDAKFFSNRLGIDLAYFNRRTVDQIFAVPSSASTGYTSRVLNSGEMKNAGVELQLSATPVQTANFSWDIALNVSKLDNEVVELADGVESINMGGTWAADLRIQEGQKYMALYGQDYVYDDNGNRLINDNGEYVFTDDRVFLGSALADWVGGFNTSINYKNFSLSGLLDYQFGGIMHSTSLQWSKYSGMHPETIEYNGQTDIRENGVVFEGVNAETGAPNEVAVDPQTYYQTFWRRAAPNIYKSDFIKLRELRLSYRLPNRLLGNSGVRDLTIAFTGRNLAILYADVPFIDPQVTTSAGNRQGLENAQIPPTRTLGFNISFKL